MYKRIHHIIHQFIYCYLIYSSVCPVSFSPSYSSTFLLILIHLSTRHSSTHQLHHTLPSLTPNSLILSLIHMHHAASLSFLSHSLTPFTPRLVGFHSLHSHMLPFSLHSQPFTSSTVTHSVIHSTFSFLQLIQLYSHSLLSSTPVTQSVTVLTNEPVTPIFSPKLTSLSLPSHYSTVTHTHLLHRQVPLAPPVTQSPTFPVSSQQGPSPPPH